MTRKKGNRIKVGTREMESTVFYCILFVPHLGEALYKFCTGADSQEFPGNVCHHALLVPRSQKLSQGLSLGYCSKGDGTHKTT